MKNIYRYEMEVKIFFYVWKSIMEDRIIGDSHSYTGLVINLQLPIWPLLCESTFQLPSQVFLIEVLLVMCMKYWLIYDLDSMMASPLPFKM